MKTITALLLGAGNRGNAYGKYSLAHPEEIKFVAVAEPDDKKREIFAQKHGISKDNCFKNWNEALNRGKIADALFVCTQDNDHYNPAIKGLELGYDLMLEKPIACTAEECNEIYKKSLEVGRTVCVCHVLRHTGFYSQVKEIIESGVLGEQTSIVMRENVGNLHYSHSYVRGNWRRAEDSNPMLLAKCCHDLDLLLWFAGKECTAVSSFGSQMHFNEQHAPNGAPERCLDGCPHRSECCYYAPSVYTPDNWMSAIMTTDTSKENILKELKTSPYGRCVYHCDNTVVDHQTVSVEFEGGLTANLIMSGFTPYTDREIYIMGTKGELRGRFDELGKIQQITVKDFLTGKLTTYDIVRGNDDHGGGDTGLMRDFVRLINDREFKNTSDISVSIKSHILGYAAERARNENTVVDFNDYCKSL